MKENDMIKMMKLIMSTVPALTLSLCLFAPHAHADSSEPTKPDPSKVAQDVVRIKALLPAGVEIGGAYGSDYDVTKNTSSIVLKNQTDYLTSVANSYVFADLNKDGKEDLVVVTEQPPTKDEQGYPVFGQRGLTIFLADAQGNLVKFAEGPKAVLNADEGGVFGDPLEGIDISRTGAIRVGHYGGSADRWSLMETFQLRNGGVYLIGVTNNSYNDLDLKGRATDINLITGDEIITTMRGEKKSDLVRHKKVPVKPLQPLSNVIADQLFQ